MAMACHQRASVLSFLAGESAFQLEGQIVRGIVCLDA
jgi:hypothetical protein